MPVRTFSATEEALLQNVGKVIRTVEPDGRIILYGSRARGDAAFDSDWDFLILLPGVVDRARITRIRYALFDVELETGEVLSSIARSVDQWNSPVYRSVPFHQNVDRDGITL